MSRSGTERPHLDTVIPDLSDEILRSGCTYFGGGRYGDVYRCQCKSEHGVREVAVKVFRFNCTMGDEGDESRTARMSHRELGIWRILKHPNIVEFLGTVSGFGRSENISLVSMWMPNGTLLDFLLTRKDQLTATNRLELVLDIARGLSYLHSFPIVHGDLSSGNVLVNDHSKACLADFGYSSLLRDDPGDFAYLQATMARPGAVRWTAPELLEETAPMTTASDIYSFGNLALFILSGKQPWSQYTRDSAIVRALVLCQKPGNPESHTMDDQHWKLIDQCWSSVLEGRPQADEIMSSLQQFLGITRIPNPQEVPTHYIRKFVDLMHQVSDRWANWDASVRIEVGDYGTLTNNGELVVEGNIYHPDFRTHLNNDLDLNLEDHPPEFGVPELAYVISSVYVKSREFSVDANAQLPEITSAVTKGTWIFPKGKRGVLTILHKPRVKRIPAIVQSKMARTDILRGKSVVTSTLVCPAYLFYLSDKSGETLLAALRDSSGWWTSMESPLLRTAHHPGDEPYFTPLFTLRQQTTPLWRMLRGMPVPSEEDLWHRARPSWDPLDEDGEEDRVDDGSSDLEEGSF